MKSGLVTVLAAAVGALLLSAPITAHHSQSVFDLQHLTNMTGEVVKLEWTNPHVIIQLDVRNDKGRVERWLISSTAPNMLQRMGWNRNTLKPGDRVTVTGNRHKEGHPLMYLRKIVLPNGEAVNVAGGN
jgi:DNA/RNA endonuclease YhcR with UshA esterase domain